MKKLFFTALGIGIVSFANAHSMSHKTISEENYVATAGNENVLWDDHGDDGDHGHGRHRGWYKHRYRDEGGRGWYRGEDYGYRVWRGREDEDEDDDCDRPVVYYPQPVYYEQPVYYTPVVVRRPGVIIHAGVTFFGR